VSKVVINRANLYHNLGFFVDKLGSIDKLCVGLKDNAYGHGILPIAKLCHDFGISKVFVRNQKEANKINHIGFDMIHILNEIPQTQTPYHITINCFDDIDNIPQNSKVQLKIDTTMHRNGIMIDEVSKAIDKIATNKLVLCGVFSHFCCADENNNKTKLQEKIFAQTIKTIKYKTNFQKHIANTNGVYRANNKTYDHARVGIGIYGYSDISQHQTQLKPVMSLVAHKNSTRVVNKGETVGYGSCSFVCSTNDFVISNYDVGYADGFFRIDENQTYRTTNGKRVLGRVSMDNISVQGDSCEIVLFDDVRVLAKLHNTITYDILVKINPDIKRVVV
jgi:alanine racemase